MSRPTWDKYFMEITELVSKRSTCLRRDELARQILKEAGVKEIKYE